MIDTERLHLCNWRDEHFEDFAAMHSDPEVMADLGGPMIESVSKRKFDRYRSAESEHRISRWAVEDLNGTFLGYAGVMPRMVTDHPLCAHYEIGWRFKRSAWGNGFASESAKVALEHAANQMDQIEIVSYTSAENLRSQAVMKRIGLVRKPSLDFSLPVGNGEFWQGLVWVVP